jgi:hypothetical protein
MSYIAVFQLAARDTVLHMDEAPTPAVAATESPETALSGEPASLAQLLTPQEIERLTQTVDPSLLALLGLC